MNNHIPTEMPASLRNKAHDPSLESHPVESPGNDPGIDAVVHDEEDLESDETSTYSPGKKFQRLVESATNIAVETS